MCQDIAVWSGGARSRGFVWGAAAVRPGLPRFADLTFWAAGAKERWCRPGRHQLAFATRGHALCGMFGDREITWYAMVWPVGTCGYLGAPPCPVAGRTARSRPVIAREGSCTDRPLTLGPLRHGWRLSRRLWDDFILRRGKLIQRPWFLLTLTAAGSARLLGRALLACRVHGVSRLFVWCLLVWVGAGAQGA